MATAKKSSFQCYSECFISNLGAAIGYMSSLFVNTYADTVATSHLAHQEYKDIFKLCVQQNCKDHNTSAEQADAGDIEQNPFEFIVHGFNEEV